MKGVPFQERKTRLREWLERATGSYPAFCRGGPLGRGVPVFVFHDVTAEYLEPYLAHLAENGYRTMLSDGLERCVYAGELPDPRTVVLCFDDAYASVYSVVVPLLKKYDLEAITYVIPGRVQEKPGGSLASWSELEQVRDSGRVDIQAHTYSHAKMFCAADVVGFFKPRSRITHMSRPALAFGKLLRFLSPDMLGAPLYLWRSRMSDARWYRDDPGCREACMAYVRAGGGARFFEDPDWSDKLRELATGGSGSFETDDERRQALRRELVGAREAISAKLGLSTVNHICMPWEICGRLTESMLAEAGYRTAIARRFCGRRIVTGKQNPFRIMRLEHTYILRLPCR